MPRLARLAFAASLAVSSLALVAASAKAEPWQPFNPFAELDAKKAARAKAAEAKRTVQPSPVPEQGIAPQAGAGTKGGPAAVSKKSSGAPAAAPTPSSPPTAVAVQQEALPPPVDKGELAPVMAADGSGLPFELWRGLDIEAVESLISTLEIPPRSLALHNLWKRLITSNVTPPAGASADAKFTALRLEALYRSGLARDAADDTGKAPPPANDPLLVALAARNELASADPKKACDMANAAAGLKGASPKRLKGQAVMMTGYCAVLAGDTASAGLAAELAREEGLEPSPGLEALDAIGIGGKPKYSAFKQLTLLDYRIAEKVGALAHKDVLDTGEPALLTALASDPGTPVDLGLPATEAAAKLNAITPEALAAIYRANAPADGADALLASPAATGLPGALRRAGLLKAAEAEQTPMKKTRLIRAFLDDAKRQNLGFQALQMAAPAAASLNPQPEISWFAETAAEIGLASGQYDLTRRWIALSEKSTAGSGLKHWLALVDIADMAEPNRGQSLSALESPAVTGRFTPDALHRLVTVLDGLSYQVPIPLWDAASRTPQPATGYLPETGVLSQLQDASKKKEFGRTVLLAMKALGPNGAEGAHMISLGDAIRSLTRAGLEADARRLGVEALLSAWPRMATN